jgi:predicted alpha/beta-fold hydrolase
VHLTKPITIEKTPSLIAKAAEHFATQPFVPHPFFKGGNAQTIAAHFWPGRFRPIDLTGDEERLFEVEPGVKVLARCRWQTNRAVAPTLVIWHGMEGSTASAYMLGTAEKAFRRGFNVVRVNYRNCGGTEHLSPTLYHGGLSSDVGAVTWELIERDRLSKLFLLGFSLGGNKVLKAAAEYGDNLPDEVKAVCAVSPSVDLRAGVELLMRRRNWIYQRNFLNRLKNRMRAKEKCFPDLYDSRGLGGIHTIREFDEKYVAPAFGFADANDYYARASSHKLIPEIRIPTLIIHAKDDPFIPCAPLCDPAIAANPNVLLVATERGGHVAFIAKKSAAEDRFWAENRVVEFCGLISGLTEE